MAEKRLLSFLAVTLVQLGVFLGSPLVAVVCQLLCRSAR